MKCTYCGDVADSLDHVVPHSIVSNSKRKNGHLTNKKDCVPCCRECNSLLGNRPALTIADRALYLSERLPSRYKKLLRLPQWDEDDFEDMSPEMVAIVKSQIEEQRLIQCRIEHCTMVSEMETLTIEEIWNE